MSRIDFIVASSGVMGVYGLRDIDDTIFSLCNLITKYWKMTAVKATRPMPGSMISGSNLVYNPDNYLIYDDIKSLHSMF